MKRIITVFISILYTLITLFSISSAYAIEAPSYEPEFHDETYLIEESIINTYATDNMEEAYGYDFEYVVETVSAESLVLLEDATDINYDFDYVTRVVTSEGGSIGYYFCEAIAQCIMNGCKREGYRYSPEELCIAYQYAKPKDFTTEDAYTACTDILLKGNECGVIGDAVYFYCSDICRSDWHESQNYEMSFDLNIGCFVYDPMNNFGGVRFFS